MTIEAPAEHQPEGRRAWVWNLVAVFVIALSLGSLFHPLWGQDLREVVPANVSKFQPHEPGGYPGGAFNESDHRFITWLIGRNAYTFATHPTRIFQAEPCYPAERALALGEPGIALGLIGVPAWWITRDPVATYNLVVLASIAFGALAMFWLVRDWTGVPVAGIVAGLLFAFHELKIDDPPHFYGWDNSWTLLALLFGRRFFAQGRWRDALALALFGSLQLAGSLYPTIGSAFLAVPALVWFVLRYGVRVPSPAQWAVVIGIVGVASLWIFSPYLELRSAGELGSRGYQYFRPWSYWLPGHVNFPGWLAIALVAVAIVWRRERLTLASVGDPRWMLLLGGLLITSMSGGGNADDETLQAFLREAPDDAGGSNLFVLLSAVIPGLDAVRSPGGMYSAAHLAFCLLAGFGAAALLRAVPGRAFPYVAGLLVLFAYVDTLRPRSLGFEPRVVFETFRLRPSEAAIGFFAELSELGASGPILEVPLDPLLVIRSSTSVLLTAYHHQRTAQCYNSNFPAAYDEVRALSESLPRNPALEALREQGFTTIVVHHEPDDISGRQRRRRFETFAEHKRDTLLEKIHESETMTAYRIRAAL